MYGFPRLMGPSRRSEPKDDDVVSALVGDLEQFTG